MAAESDSTPNVVAPPQSIGEANNTPETDVDSENDKKLPTTGDPNSDKGIHGIPIFP